MTLHLTRVTRRYSNRDEPTRKAMTARLANEIAEEAKSRELVAEYNDRVKRRRFERTPGWWACI